MAPELVHTDSNHPHTEPQVENLDSLANDPKSGSITKPPYLKVPEDYVTSVLSKFLVGNEETL